MNWLMGKLKINGWAKQGKSGQKNKYILLMCCFFSFWFVLGFTFHSRIFHSSSQYRLRVQILPFARHSWPLSNDLWFSFPHLLWHRASVCNGHYRGPATLNPVAERLAVELSLGVFTVNVSGGWDSNTKPYACKAAALTDCVNTAV